MKMNGASFDQSRDRRRASFETRPLDAPQDEEGRFYQAQIFLILRRHEAPSQRTHRASCSPPYFIPTTKIPAASAARATASRSRIRTVPASAAIPRSPAACGRGDGLGADHRPVGAALLAGLLNLDEHPAGPFAPERAAAPQERVGTLDRLDPEHHAPAARRPPGRYRARRDARDSMPADVRRAATLGCRRPSVPFGPRHHRALEQPLGTDQVEPSSSSSLITAESSPSSPSAR